MKEAEHNTNAVRSFKHYGYGAHKLSDQGGKFAGAKPCDIIARSPLGRYIAVEGKLIKKWEGFNSKVLRDNQRAELEKTSLTKEGMAFIFLYVHIPKECHYCVVFDWRTHKELLDQGIQICDMRAMRFGLWLPAIKDKDGKTIYNITKIMKRAR